MARSNKSKFRRNEKPQRRTRDPKLSNTLVLRSPKKSFQSDLFFSSLEDQNTPLFDQSDVFQSRPTSLTVFPRQPVHQDAQRAGKLTAKTIFDEIRYQRISDAIDNAFICHQRNVRKQVMHALGHAGKGGQKPAQWTFKSRKKCG